MKYLLRYFQDAKDWISLVLGVVIIIMASTARAQNQSEIWYFGNKAGLSFAGGAPAALLDGQLHTSEGCAVVSDKNGSLLFYTDGITVWNKNHDSMPNGRGLLGGWSSTQSAIIIPLQGNCNIYYVITAYGAPSNGDIRYLGDIRYSIVDMSLAGGLGDIVAGQKNIFLATGCGEKITAVNHANGKDKWIFVHKLGSNQFLSFLFTSTGIDTVPVTTAVGTYHDATAIIGYSRASHSEKKFAVAATYNHPPFVEVFDLNQMDGTLSNPTKINFSGEAPYGLEFSPNDRFLYISCIQYGPALYQCELATKALQKVAPTVPTGYDYGALQYASDGKIYVARYDQPYLSSIDNPDGYSCNFVETSVLLGGRTCLLGLPNFIQSNFKPLCLTANFSNNTVCLGDTTIFIDSVTGSACFNGNPGIEWNFGDGASSTLHNPRHTYKSAGSYAVKLVVMNDAPCSNDSITKIVQVKAPPIPNAGSDISICAGDSAQLNAWGGTTSYIWTPSTGLSKDNISNPKASPQTTTTYTVTVIIGSCSGKDSVTVTVLPKTSYTLSSTSINLGTANVDSTKHGTLEFTNTTPGSIHIRSVKFTGTVFNGKVVTSFPRTVLSNETITIECSGTPKDTGVFTDELCIEIDSACSALVCLPVTIEGTSVCVKTETSAMKEKHPGDEVTIPIVVDPTTKLASSKQITLTVEYDPSMLRMTGNPTSSYDASPTVISITPGAISFVIKPTSTFTTTSVTVAYLHFQVLLSSKTRSEIKVTSSEFKLSPTEIITGGNCSEPFTVDSSCIMPGSLQNRSSVVVEGIYPNPSFHSARVVLHSTGDSHVRVETYDTFGRKVETVFDGDLSQGSHKITISTEKYAEGIYFCRLLQGDKILTRAFNVQR